MQPPDVFSTANATYVSTGGIDATADGSQARPYATIQAAVTAATALDHIVVMPGTYTENVVVDKQLYFGCLVPGSATLSNTTAAGSVLSFTGAATDGCFWDGINITNLSAAGAAAIALNFTGFAGMAGQFFFRNCQINSGAGASTAVNFAGLAANPITVDIEGVRINGGNLIAMADVDDLVIFRNCTFATGPANWFQLTGTVAANLQLISCDLLGLGGTETFNHGNNTAATAISTLRDCRINGALNLNTTAATGYVVCNGGTWVRNITYGSDSQRMHKHIGGDEWEFGVYSIPLNAVAATTLYTNPAGRTFVPSQVFTENRGAASGAALQYRYNGTGNGSIVAAVGAAALPIGVQPETVLNDEVAAAGTIQFDVTIGSGVGGDRANAHVRGFVT